MQDVTDYKQLIKEINEKIARKIMNNSVYGKLGNTNEPDILMQYFNKKEKEYNDNRHAAIKKVYDNTTIGKAINTFIKAIQNANCKDVETPKFDSLWTNKFLTINELKAIDAANDEYHTNIMKLNNLCQECAAILVNCETFEQKMTVLQKYDIIDSDYKLKA
jgi:hypothetical protein